MRDLVPVDVQRTFVVCPGTDDGIACSIILNRRFPESKTFFLPEYSVADIFSYPALKNNLHGTRLFLAGFPFQERVGEFLENGLPKETTWYSHHFWSKGAFDRLSGAGVTLRVDTGFSDTSRLLVESSDRKDPVAIGAAEFLARGNLPESEEWRPWFFLSLAVRGDLYGIRHALAPLFNSGEKNVPAPSEEEVSNGRAVFANLESHIQSSNPYSFPIGSTKETGCVLVIPTSLFAYFRNLSGIIFDQIGHAMILLLVDGENQVIIRVDEKVRDVFPVRRLAEGIDVAFGRASTRLFDRNTIVIDTGGRQVVKVIDEIIQELKTGVATDT